MEHELEMELVPGQCIVCVCVWGGGVCGVGWGVSIPSHLPHPPEGWEEMGGNEGGGWDGQDGVVPDADPVVPGVDLVVPDVHVVVPDANKDLPGPHPRMSFFKFV